MCIFVRIHEYIKNGYYEYGIHMFGDEMVFKARLGFYVSLLNLNP